MAQSPILRDKLSLKRENVATSRSGSNPAPVSILRFAFERHKGEGALRKSLVWNYSKAVRRLACVQPPALKNKTGLDVHRVYKLLISLALVVRSFLLLQSCYRLRGKKSLFAGAFLVPLCFPKSCVVYYQSTIPFPFSFTLCFQIKD